MGNLEEASKRIAEAARLSAHTLNLRGLQLSALPESITLLHSLTSIDLGDNDLTHFPPTLFELSGLVELRLYRNRISVVPPEISEITSLTTIDLADNALPGLPEAIGKLPNLRQLHLERNLFDAVPTGILNLSGLRVLSLAGNRLRNIPDEIGGLSNLESLGLEDNQLTELSPAIASLTQLTHLNVGRNSIDKLPSWICNLSSLEMLHLWGNNLEDLPSCIQQLENLTALNIGSNRFRETPPEVLGLTRLTHLYLDHNKLSSLPAGIGNLANLQQLGLNDNDLVDLPAEISRLSGLSEVALDENRWEDGWLVLSQNPLRADLAQAAQEGLSHLKSHLVDLDNGGMDHDPLEVSTPLAGAGAVRDYVADLEFRDKIGPAEAGELRTQLERLIGLISVELDDGTFAADPLTETRLNADRNYLQHELASSPEIDTAVVVPIAQRLQSDLLLAMTLTDSDARLASKLAGHPDPDPQDAETAIDRAQAIAEALEASERAVPTGYQSWSHWLTQRLGWSSGPARI